MNIVDLGLVYGIEVSSRSVQVRMTVTSAALPMTELIVEDMHEQLAAALSPDSAIDVELVWEPPWTPGRMSQAARSIFGCSRSVVRGWLIHSTTSGSGTSSTSRAWLRRTDRQHGRGSGATALAWPGRCRAP
jgi:metal-sulfur cluster biosynthetic enzyme